MDDIKRLQRLTARPIKPHMVLDTDCYNEQDDQYALSYAVKSAQAGEIYLDAVYAAPFTHGVNRDKPTAGEGMEQSYNEILHLLSLLGIKDTQGFAFRGSGRFMNGTPVDSPAADDLIKKALAMPEDEPLYVLAIGAPTNVSSAIVKCPEIIEKIVVIWLGGTAVSWPAANEYNLEQDYAASRVLLDCGVPLVQLPCAGCVEKFRTTVQEAQSFLEGKNEISDYLLSLLKNIRGGGAWSKVIWDATTVAYLIHPEWFRTNIMHTPRLTRDEMDVTALGSIYDGFYPRYYWTPDSTRHLFATVEDFSRDAIYSDLFAKLTK